MTRDKAGKRMPGTGSGLRRYAALLGVASLGLSGCTDWAGYDLDRLWGELSPALATLRGSVAYEPYELPRLPAQGTVPVAGPGMVENLPPFTQEQLDSVGAALANPLPATQEVLAQGEHIYNNQCAVCHGLQGAGNGTVVGPGKYPFAPAINGAPTAARSDGYLYAVIRVGRGLMPAYGERINHMERWAVVHYMRQLQQAGGVAPAPAAAPTVTNPQNAPAPAGGAAPADTPQTVR